MQLITVDFDGTLFEGDSFKLMFQAGKQEFGIREWSTVFIGTLKSLFMGIIRGKQALRNQFFQSFAETFKGKKQEELSGFFNHLVEAGKHQINTALVEEILSHQANGRKVIILSGALTPFLQALIAKLDLDVTTIGTELLFNESGICTGKTDVVINGEEKVNAVTRWLEKAQLNPEETEIWAYADSESDIPLLHFVDHPVIVNPKNNMREVAKNNHWPIYGES